MTDKEASDVGSHESRPLLARAQRHCDVRVSAHRGLLSSHLAHGAPVRCVALSAAARMSVDASFHASRARRTWRRRQAGAGRHAVTHEVPAYGLWTLVVLNSLV